MIAQVRAVALLGLLFASAAPAQAPVKSGPRRLAVVVGARAGAVGRSSLQYAHRDAEQVASALRAVAEFRPEDIQLLLEPQPDEVLEALDAARAKAARAEEGALLLFYYSGHADDRALYPSGKRLEFADVRPRLDSGATIRIGIIDACRGGGWTGAKGLRETDSFELRPPMSLDAEGSILLSSSSGNEDAHEAEAIGGSIFTHHLVAALRGAGDGDGDGTVSVAEAFAFARELTIRDSTLLTKSPQNPSFSFNIRGRMDLPLARPQASPVRVSIQQHTGPIEILDRSSGRKLIELASGERTVELALPPGRYLALRRREGQALSLEFRLGNTERVVVEEDKLIHTPQLVTASKGLVEGPRNTLSADVAGIPFGHLRFEYERTLNFDWSLYVAPGLQLPSERDPSYRPDLRFGGRYFFFGAAPGGWFLGAETALQVAVAQTGTAGRVGVAMHLGFTGIAAQRFLVSVSAGPSYDYVVWNQTGGPPPGQSGFAGELRTMLGAAF